MAYLYEDEFYRARLDGDILRLERTAKNYPTMGAMHAAHTALASAINDVKVRGVLLDLRGGPPGRNDAAFERQSATWRNRLRERAGRVAILVRTAVGKLQSQRLAREEGHADTHNVFLDENEALAYLRG